jgi:hypothetical protein
MHICPAAKRPGVYHVLYKQVGMSAVGGYSVQGTTGEKGKLPLCLTKYTMNTFLYLKHHAMKTFWEVEV